VPKRALKGTRSTLAAPSVEELTGTAIDRRRAILDGHYGALLQELNASLRAAFRVANRRKPEDMPVFPMAASMRISSHLFRSRVWSGKNRSPL
jgi:hypothetical protein